MAGTNSKRILGLVGSPRKLGNCEVFIKELSTYISNKHTLNLIRMPLLNIVPCHACYKCIMDKPCLIKDNMGFLLDQILQCDALIIASPVYFLGTHSIFKRVLDRGFMFYKYIERTNNKPCVLVNFYGMEEKIGVAPQTLMTLAISLGMNIRANLSLKAALPGEVLMNEGYKKLAEKIGQTLFSDEIIVNSHGCPFCGCEIVRIGEIGFICTVCHGHFSIDCNGNKVKIKRGDILGSSQHVLLHKEWLKSMKNKFLEEREEILRRVDKYKNIGEWIKP